jgi:hypothetical protein
MDTEGEVIAQTIVFFSMALENLTRCTSIQRPEGAEERKCLVDKNRKTSVNGYPHSLNLTQEER